MSKPSAPQASASCPEIKTFPSTQAYVATAPFVIVTWLGLTSIAFSGAVVEQLFSGQSLNKN